ncbi:MAG: methylated-DNA--[protein]-cysteine S-methyltransferase [Candidatus Nanopelagicales bacterium]|nr:methylated-DNA--[protein]-cysteine S-methyltransferase [Candidatus Nanopelagicales bacterium]
MSERWELVPSPLGDLLLVGDRFAVTEVRFTQSPERPDQPGRAPAHPVAADPDSRGFTEPTRAMADQLAEYFAGRRRQFDVPVRLRGTPFQRAVWDALRRIPYGETWSYGQVARLINHPRAYRAVGTANNRNPLVIVIPCHRVVSSRGVPVGFGGGLNRQEQLLHLETLSTVPAEPGDSPPHF